MIKQNVFIINFSSLYEILDEIKENLTFNIIKFENEDSFIKECNLDAMNSLIVMQSSQKLLLHKKIIDNNTLKLNNLPLSFSEILEIINIQLIKLKFNHQSQIFIKGYELNLNSKFISKNNFSLKLTEKEIEIILYLDKFKIKHSVEDLQKNIWGYSPDMETHTVETHIYRLRKKISNKFHDESFILSHKNGYFID